MEHSAILFACFTIESLLAVADRSKTWYLCFWLGLQLECSCDDVGMCSVSAAEGLQSWLGRDQGHLTLTFTVSLR